MRRSGFVMKTVLCGDPNVGKESIRRQYLGQGFQSTYLMTIGADFAVKSTTINYNGICYSVKFQIWDLAGQPRFGTVRSVYYYGCLGALLVFDVTRPDTFTNLESWIDEIFKRIKQTINRAAHFRVVIIGQIKWKNWTRPIDGPVFLLHHIKRPL